MQSECKARLLRRLNQALTALIREAEKFTAESFEKAIEMWREAGDDNRLIAGVEELTRIY